MTADLFPNDRKSAARTAARAVLRQIVARRGGKVCAAACHLAESHLSKALSEQPDDRYLRDEHIDAILMLASDAEIAAYWDTRLAGYDRKSAPVRTRTDAERLAALEEAIIRRAGLTGIEVVDAERAKP